MRPIDADVLSEKILDVVRHVIAESEFTEGYTSGLYAVAEQIKEEPTIEQPQWISCAERLPETWQRVLAYREGYGILSDVILSGGEWCGDLDTKQAVTYWMPLPEPPKGDE